ncbi:MAG: serine/threonine-protein kinase [Gemmatimonadota bacterium]
MMDSPGTPDTVVPVERLGPDPGTKLAHEVPPDILRGAGRRLQILAAAISAGIAVNLIIYRLVPLLGGPQFGDPPGPIDIDVIVLGMLLLSIGVFFIARFEWLSPARLLDAGLVYEVLLAFGAGVAIQAFAQSLRLPRWGISEVCILILLFPVIVPNTPGKVLLASLAAASMDPLGDLLYGLGGGATPSVSELVGAYHFNYLSAGLALIPAHVLTTLARQVQAARELGSYRLIERISRGGMGEVWRAEHRMLARPAAIKLIRRDMMARDGEDRDVLQQRFEREANATALLSSPHTVELYDFGVTSDGTFYYVMELLDGLDMHSLVERYGPLGPDRAVYLLGQVCESLAEAHERGLVHRDIKPANVYVCRYGLEVDFVKVVDFGLVGVRPGMPQTDGSLAIKGTPEGTPAFMAPEQILGDQPVGVRTDIYAVGCLAYWLLTGGWVFEGETAMEVLVRHVREAPPPPSSRSELPIPVCLDEAILACLEKDPDRRPPSAEALALRLASCVSESAHWAERGAREWWDIHRPPASPPAAGGGRKPSAGPSVP